MDDEWIEVPDRKKKPERDRVAAGGKPAYFKPVKTDKNEFKSVFPKAVLKRGEPLIAGGASSKTGGSASASGGIAKPPSNQPINSKPKAVIVNKPVDNVGVKPQKRQPVALFDLILAPKVKQSKPESVAVKPTVSSSSSSNKGIDRDAKTKHKLDSVAYYDENNKLTMRTKKKKLSIIKKKILLERLNRYVKMKQAEIAATPVPLEGEGGNEVLCILNFVQQDELQDHDERKEIEENVKEIVAPFGSLVSVSFGPGAGSEDQIVYVRFGSASAASAASISLNGFVIGGNTIRTYTASSTQLPLSSLSGDDSPGNRDDDEQVLVTTTSADTAEMAAVVCLENLVFEGDVTDADETNEMLQDVRRLCSSKDDYLTSIWIESVATAAQNAPSGKSVALAAPWGVVEYFSIDTAVARCRDLHGVVIGGTRIEACLYDYELYKQGVFTEEGLIPCAHTSLDSDYAIKILGFIEDGQVEDEDEASDIKEELHKLVSDLLPEGDVGAVKEVVFTPSRSHVNYHDTLVALHLSLDGCRSLMSALEGLEIGGVKLEYQLVVGSDQPRVACDTNKNAVLVLKNFITDDDVSVASVNPLAHDPSGFYSHSEELLAIKMDLLTLAKGEHATHAVVKRLFIEVSNAPRSSDRCLPVCIGFSSLSVAEEVMIYLEGTMIGGGVIKSFLRRTDDGPTRQDYVAAVSMTAKQATTEKLNQVAPSEHAAGVVPPVSVLGEEAAVKVVDAAPTAVVSKYVEAATAPKQPRHTSVCMMSVKKANDEIDKLIQTTLNTLAGYQKRLKENEPLKAKQKMRFVCGLKQCLNGVKSERAILVLVAPDTEESEALDSKLDDLIREAQAREIPILFCLSRRKLAKSILASTRQAAVAVYNADGVFKEVQRIAQYAKAGDSTTL